jgi:hypothetical protein
VPPCRVRGFARCSNWSTCWCDQHAYLHLFGFKGNLFNTAVSQFVITRVLATSKRLLQHHHTPYLFINADNGLIFVCLHGSTPTTCISAAGESLSTPEHLKSVGGLVSL